MEREQSSGGLGGGGFEPTRWTIVLEAAQSRAEGGLPAFARVYERYWTPLYAFARRRGHSTEDAQDLVQGFFEHLLGSKALLTVDQKKGRFRSFLLSSFQNFISNEWRRANAEKRGGQIELLRLDWEDAESRVVFEASDPLTPETIYDARWALELLGRALHRLEEEQTVLGKSESFRILRAFLASDSVSTAMTYADAADALNVPLSAVKTTIHRLRRRYAQLLRQEVAETLANPDDLESEVRALCEALLLAEGRVRL
jgi:RNA polymerase sigma factor (sigma-70 family)